VPNPQSRSTNERGALWYLIVLSLLHRELDVRFVHPGTLKRYATGSGNADKASVKAATTVTFPAVRTRTDDERDALWLAAVGVHLLGGPLPYPVTPVRADVITRLNRQEKAA
jgi:Holliday junction resolvasome RuvABC endonuclease subunit